MKQTKQLDWPSLLLLTAILFGGLVRVMPAWVARFPLNDGGMFLDMTRDLGANHYLIPATTTYNGLGLPYAYPPLGFYVASLLADLGRIPLLDLFLWLPAFLSVLTIPAFYLLARALLADDLRAAFATLFFALTPGSYFWPIMGGGVTRAFGMLFMMLALFFVLRLFQSGRLPPQPFTTETRTCPGGRCQGRHGDSKVNSPRLRDSAVQTSALQIFLAILFCSFAVLSHPEVGIQTAGACFVLWLFFGRTWRSALHALLISMGVLLLTAPWWETVIAQHGLAPFLSALQTGQHASIKWLSLVGSLFATGEFIPLLLILRLAGFIYALWKRQFIFIALIVVSALVDPRSAGAVSLLAMSMLSAFGFLDVLPALLQKLRRAEIRPVLEYRFGVAALFLVACALFIECGLLNFRLINTTLTPSDREAMTWVQQDLPPGNNFFLVTGTTYSMSDPVQEWFPTLTGQHNQTVLQGLEWTLGDRFNARLNDLVLLQACADLACVESWSARTGLAYDYLWVGKFPASDSSDAARRTRYLLAELDRSAAYRLVHENGSAAIYVKVKK